MTRRNCFGGGGFCALASEIPKIPAPCMRRRRQVDFLYRPFSFLFLPPPAIARAVSIFYCDFLMDVTAKGPPRRRDISGGAGASLTRRPLSLARARSLPLTHSGMTSRALNFAAMPCHFIHSGTLLTFVRRRCSPWLD